MALVELTEAEQALLAAVKDHREARATALQIEEFGARVQRTLVQLLTHAVSELEAEKHPAIPADYVKQQASQLLAQMNSQFSDEKMVEWTKQTSVLGYDPVGILVTNKVMADALAALVAVADDGSDLAEVVAEIANRFSTPDTPWA